METICLPTFKWQVDGGALRKSSENGKWNETFDFCLVSQVVTHNNSERSSSYLNFIIHITHMLGTYTSAHNFLNRKALIFIYSNRCGFHLNMGFLPFNGWPDWIHHFCFYACCNCTVWAFFPCLIYLCRVSVFLDSWLL